MQELPRPLIDHPAVAILSAAGGIAGSASAMPAVGYYADTGTRPLPVAHQREFEVEKLTLGPALTPTSMRFNAMSGRTIEDQLPPCTFRLTRPFPSSGRGKRDCDRRLSRSILGITIARYVIPTEHHYVDDAYQ